MVFNNTLILQFGMLNIKTASAANITYPITFTNSAFPFLQTAWSGNQSVILTVNNLNGSTFTGNVGKGTWFVIGF